jgi:hypothetical protein
MEDNLSTKAFAGQTRSLARHSDAVWCEITDAYRLNEPVGAKHLASLAFCKSDRYIEVYQELVMRNIAVEHAVADTGEPQDIRLTGKWVLCDESAQVDWKAHRIYALKFATPSRSR